MVSATSHIAKETCVSIAINAILSMVFFLLVFGPSEPAPVWGFGNYVFDFLPQSFMIAFMSALVPGTLALRKLRTGQIDVLPGKSRLPNALLARAFLLAVISSIFGVAAAAALLELSGQEMVAWGPAFAIKIAYGALLAVIVTPIGLRATLCGFRSR